jgi:hypothetical protein
MGKFDLADVWRQRNDLCGPPRHIQRIPSQPSHERTNAAFCRLLAVIRRQGHGGIADDSRAGLNANKIRSISTAYSISDYYYHVSVGVNTRQYLYTLPSAHSQRSVAQEQLEEQWSGGQS